MCSRLTSRTHTHTLKQITPLHCGAHNARCQPLFRCKKAATATPIQSALTLTYRRSLALALSCFHSTTTESSNSLLATVGLETVSRWYAHQEGQEQQFQNQVPHTQQRPRSGLYTYVYVLYYPGYWHELQKNHSFWIVLFFEECNPFWIN